MSEQARQNVMTILITGSRDFTKRAAIWTPLDRLLVQHGRIVLFNGKCPRGADRIASDWARARKARGADEIPFYADWDTHDNQAGFIRNGDMVKARPTMAMVWANPCTKKDRRWCPPGEHPSHGTADCVQQAREAKIPVFFSPAGMSW